MSAATIPDLAGWRSVHLVGIGGAGMNGIARLLMARGMRITGSDLKDAGGLDPLRQAGATVFVGHRAVHVDRPDAVVTSSAVPADNVEVREARRLGLPLLTRAQVLAALMRGKRTVAVAGTHGKTTTTSMIAVMLSRAGLDPTYVIGGDLNESGSGAGHGSGEVFVAEADESDGSFLLLRPDVAVVTNVEEDHLDYYAGREDVESAFAQFARQAGTVIACWDDPGVQRALDGLPATIHRYGTGEGSEVRLVDQELFRNGAKASVEIGGRRIGFTLSIPGRHNLLNAAAALAVADLLEVPLEEAARGLRSFSGVRRRFERRGTARGATFIDDYAHHPSEVAATLEAARIDGPRRIVAVFQPHRYSRTRAMWRALGESLTAADVAVFTDVYGAGERPIPGVTGKLLVDAFAEAAPGKRVVYLPRRSDVPPFLVREARSGDLVIALGAGDITMALEETLERLREME
jgi:UDP-N-acetylmuramate--alanine ligase